MEPFAGIDAAMLSFDNGTTKLHVAAVLVLDPPEGRRSLFSPSTRFAQMRRLIEHRLHLVPRLRQRALQVPLGLHRPVWVDDPDFDLDDHLTRASLPAPGGSRELDTLIAEIMGRPIDLDRPLWEMVVVEGLAEGRSALVAKLHHALLDGVSGASVLAQFLDLSPRERVVEDPEPWDPEPLPSSATLMRYAMTGMAQQPAVIAEALHRSVDALNEISAHKRHLNDEGEKAPPPGMFSAPRTRLNGSLSSRRRYASVSVPLADIKLVRHTFGATVNDVLLATVGGALRRYLARHGSLPDAPLVAMVPVSTRTDDDPALGNRISGMLVSLATDIADPVERLTTIAAGTQVAKEQQQITGGHLFEDVASMASPAVTSRAIRWISGLRVFDHLRPPFSLVMSSVPGPSFPLWCAGSRVVGLNPVGPIGEGAGLNVTAMTYMGDIYFGILGCRRLVPDVQDLAIMVDDAAAELVLAALDAERVAG
jgi:WS/DGAT/MGAT family acyltransferase